MISFKNLVEQKLGTFPQFLIYAILEWIMIILLFIDGILAFVSTQFAKFFDLTVPCLLCTRIDHMLIHKNSSFYYNDSICEVHKKDISALAYCDIHRKLSDIRGMCQGCLVGILNKDDCLLKPVKKDENNEDKSGINSRCACCGETLKFRASSKHTRNLSINGPTRSPRASFLVSRNEEGRNVESPRVRYGDVKVMGGRESESLNEDNQGRENARNTNNEDSNRTPNFGRGGNKFFAIPLNSAPASPRLLTRNIRKLTIKKGDNNIVGPNDSISLDEVDGEILNRMKRQVRLDQQSLMDLYMELDEERSASAVAANNAMAMITRLQAEKAAVQMEALQYQRMMEEQAEYDEEAIQEMRDLLLKREEEMKDLECEVEAYRVRFGEIKNIIHMGSEICEIDGDEDYLERNSSFFDEKSDYGSLNGEETGGNNKEELDLDFEGERIYLRGLLADLEKQINADEGSDSLIKHEDEGKGDGDEVTFKREVSMIKDRLRAIEADSGFLKHAAMTLQRGEKGTELLTEIAQHLRKLRESVKSSFEDTNNT